MPHVVLDLVPAFLVAGDRDWQSAYLLCYCAQESDWSDSRKYYFILV